MATDAGAGAAPATRRPAAVGVAAARGVAAAPAERAPELAFAVEGAAVPRYAAAPSLAFTLRVDAPPGVAVRALALDAEIRIAAERRRYAPAARPRLSELFGPPEAWGRSVRALAWARASVQVPAFSGSTRVELVVPCSYDFDVAAAKYLDALGEGDVPLDFLLAGSVFYGGADGRLQVARLPWNHEPRFALPVRLWRAAMDSHFPGTAWLRLGRESFDRLCAFRAARGLASWEAVLAAALDAAEAAGAAAPGSGRAAGAPAAGQPPSPAPGRAP